MALTNDENRKVNSELYTALMDKDHDIVLDICAGIPKGPLHQLTIHGDTVIHMAAYHKKNKLTLDLLNMVPMSDNHKLTLQNDGGNTILHETAINNRTVQAAAEMLRRAPMLLSMANKQGETALFYAARHGKTKIFKFLHDEVMRTIQGPDLITFLQRDDKSTILHLAVLSRNYWMAHEIAVKHKHLIHMKDGDKMTPLQLLSRYPLEFCRNNLLKRMIYKLIDPDIEYTAWWLKKMQKNKFRCEWASKLVKVLVKADTSWEATESRSDKYGSKFHQYGKMTAQEQEKGSSIAATITRLRHTPLLEATKHGCTEVVEEILSVYPQAIEHVDRGGRNILHVAILYRNHKTFDLVVSKEYPKDRLRGKVDHNYNTLLHMVGEEVDDAKADLKGPAIVLQEGVLLFKRVEKICTTLDTMKLNQESKTAMQVFHERNDKRRLDAKEWMSELAKNCTIVAVLIATVAFAALYTVPGGLEEETGEPILKDKPLFLVFTIADAGAMSSSLTSIIVFLNMVTSSYRFKDFESSLVNKLYVGLTLLMVSVAMMMVAFETTLILTVNTGDKLTDIVLYSVSFFPVSVFMSIYADFYWMIVQGAFRGTKRMVDKVLGWFRNPERQPAVWHSRPQRGTTPFV